MVVESQAKYVNESSLLGLTQLHFTDQETEVQKG